MIRRSVVLTGGTVLDEQKLRNMGEHGVPLAGSPVTNSQSSLKMAAAVASPKDIQELKDLAAAVSPKKKPARYEASTSGRAFS
jgi:hypothetical protein